MTSFVDATVTGSTTYSYTIAALDAAGNASAQSSAAGATTPSGTPPADATAPSVPSGLTGSVVAAGRIDLAWSASSDDVAVAGYAVYRDGNKITSVPVGSTSYSDTGLTPGVSHTYTVTALDAAANESAQSGSWSGAAETGSLANEVRFSGERTDTESGLEFLRARGHAPSSGVNRPPACERNQTATPSLSRSPRVVAGTPPISRCMDAWGR